MTAKKQSTEEDALRKESEVPYNSEQPTEESTDTPTENETITVVYVGPTVPNTTLVENSFVSGTRETIDKYFDSGLSRHPSAKALIIPTDALAESRTMLKTAGSYLSRIYSEIAAATKS